MERVIKEGDVVWLKSGGLPMTVERPLDEEKKTWRCYWFDENNKPARLDISASALTLEMPESGLIKESRPPIGFR